MHWSQRLQAAWQDRGWLAWALWPVASVYGLVTGLRRALYRWAWLRPLHLPVTVIVVGNLVAGGAGKTPTVLALVRWLKAQGLQPGVLSRGHGGSASTVREVQPSTAAVDCGDEPLLIRLRGQVPVFVGRDRVAAGHRLLQRHPEVNVLVCDDGLQHLRLARDLQVVVFDERGAGNRFLLPAGPLREPLPHRLPDHSLVLYNAAQASTRLPGHVVRRQLSGLVPLVDWWAGEAASSDALQRFKGRDVVAAAGMARPQRFFDMLKQAGMQVQALPLPDHHAYAELPWPLTGADVIVTEKDAVKLIPPRIGLARVWVAALDFGFDAGFEAALRQQLAALVPATWASTPASVSTDSPQDPTPHGNPIA